MTSTPESDLVFTDLSDAIGALEQARGSPKEVRRAFSRFADLTQRLTSAMRLDYSRVKISNWNATAFIGWNTVTDFFKWLRNEDQHGDQSYISVHERRFYPVDRTESKLFVFEGTWNLIDQNTDQPPDGITFHPVDPETGSISDVVVSPVRIEHFYILQARSNEATSRLRQAGTSDVHLLSRSCFDTLSQYYAFFLQQTGA